MGEYISLLGSVNSASASYQSGKAQRSLANLHADLLDRQAADAVKIGEEQVQGAMRQSAQIQGAQRAAGASSGIVVNQGSNADIQADTRTITAQDVATIRTNAARQAWGIKTNASIGRFEGKMAQRASNSQAAGTLLTGAGQYYKDYRMKG